MRQSIRLTILVQVMFTFTMSSCKTRSSSALRDKPGPTSETEVAEAMKIIGVRQPQGQAFCGDTCHGSTTGGWHELTKSEILSKWLPNAQAVANCFGSTENAVDRIDCFRENGQFTTDSVKQLSVYRAGAKYSFFSDMFTEAFGEDSTEYKDFLYGANARPSAQMPVPNAQLEGLHGFLTEEQFTKVIRVFTATDAREQLEKFFGTDQIIAQECVPAVSDELKQHIKNMKQSGWASELTNTPDKRRVMFGCQYGGSDFNRFTSPIKRCFLGADRDQSNFSFPWAQDWDKAIDPADNRILTQNIRVLSDLKGCRTTFWMRSSADGRFVGNGSRGCPASARLPDGSKGFFIDLKTTGLIGVNAPFDPNFCPDNSCFTFIASGSARFCKQEMLLPDSSGQQRSFVDMASAENKKFCSDGNLGVYQHIGSALDGVRHVVIRSDKYANDDGGATNYRTDPPVEKFAIEHSWADLYKMCQEGKCGEGLNTGITPSGNTPYGFTSKIRIEVPFEGDWGISPSSLLLTSRIARKDRTGQVGYRLRKYDIDSMTPSSKDVGTVCMKGGKASVSYDERFIITHHYVDSSDWKELNKSLKGAAVFQGADDPRFKDYVTNSANIYITDLWTSQTYRLTFMGQGQFALYPHFRADGWFYFLVRDYNQNKNFVVASDAALQLALKYPL